MSDFDDLIAEIEAEAHAAGPEAVAELEAFRRYFAGERRRAVGHQEASADVAASMLGIS